MLRLDKLFSVLLSMTVVSSMDRTGTAVHGFAFSSFPIEKSVSNRCPSNVEVPSAHQPVQSRRDIFHKVASSIAIVTSLVVLPTEFAVASGGATAGKYT